ncbi:G2/mitotic-specific cyclin-B [Nilaparvata lugens]|uniref:G2/mitotic-specific cyclin-B n=1 Tax=Nilaparvata lugens TaxID=108931 RepID=UPI000B98F26E|nr:G2/mitotic-specific cyclin-B [Nilaparvata lugens]
MALHLRNGQTINRINSASQENLNVNRAGKSVATTGAKQGLVDITKKANGGLQLRGDKRAALGEISRNVANPAPVSNLKKEAFTKPVAPLPVKTTTNPVVRTTRTVLARQSLLAKATALPKVLSTSTASKVLSTSTASKASLASSSIARSSNALPKREVKAPTTKKEKKQPAFGIPYNIRGPQVPTDADFRDFDKEMGNNQLFMGIYCPDMFAYLKELESKFLVKENFLEELVVTSKMRAMVVDWLVDVQQQYNLLLETLHLSIGIFDRFLEKHRSITKNKLQLAGVTAMWIAAKYEELFAPEIENFVFIADNAFTKKAILEMECVIHNALDFCYGMPLAIHFLRRYSHVSEAEAKHHMISKYLLELSRLEYAFCSVRPSLVAAAALGTAYCIVEGKDKPDRSVWSQALVFYTTYTLEDVKPYIASLANLVVKAETSKLRGIQKKYSSTKQMKISIYLSNKIDLLKSLSQVEED